MQTYPVKKRKCLNVRTHRFFPVETMAKGMRSLDQFAECVLSYTSKYNLSVSVSYAPDNVVGKYEVYPSYGDFPETYFLRTYGTWWKESEAHQQEYRPQEVDVFGAEDYISLGFEIPVVPRDVCIYETYNPGAVVRIWGRFTSQDWKLLWEGAPQMCPEKARKFHPTIRQYNCLMNEIRLEFSQSHLKYHTSIDAVVLGGFETDHVLLHNILANDLLHSEHESAVSQVPAHNSDAYDYFSGLPVEVMVHIFQNLDLTSLSRCSQVNKTWYTVSLDPILYQNLSLKKYWNAVDEHALDYFSQRCRILKKLDMSWCGPHKYNDKCFQGAFICFLRDCCKHLTHLSLCHCEFVNNTIVTELQACRDLTELRLRNIAVSSGAFQGLSSLSKLVTLDLSTTRITDEPLVAILQSNTNLRHINLNFCEYVERLDNIVATAVEFNKNLTSWSSFKATALTANGARLFGAFANLKELDLGWCFMRTDSEDSLVRISEGCSQLKRLIISKWRGVTEQMLLYLLRCCKKLTQLDVLGMTAVGGDFCDTALRFLPDLRLLDISFCDRITHDQVVKWRQEFPQVAIQRSCRYVVRDFLN